MAAKRSLNAKNLEALGAQRLAELLMEASKGNSTLQRRLRAELASLTGPEEAAKEVRKRLRTIAKAKTLVDAQKRPALVSDLDMQRRVIVDRVAPYNSAEAVDLLFSFLRISRPVLERCFDRTGAVEDVFYQVQTDLVPVIQSAQANPEYLADQIFEALKADRMLITEELISELGPFLGSQGLETLKERLTELRESTSTTPPDDERVLVGMSSNGPIYADQIEARSTERIASIALTQIADIENDVDAYIRQFDDRALYSPLIAAQIARRLVAANRATEAQNYLEYSGNLSPSLIPEEWHHAYAETLEALGYQDKAQDYRWKCFQRWLDGDFLQAYLKRLPDFDDLEAEEFAMTAAKKSPHFHEALAFLINWGAPKSAAELVVSRSDEIDGDLYQVLVPAADALEAKYPLAATLLRRAMINYTLTYSITTRYRHAAKHFLQCKSLAASISDYQGFETHEAFQSRIEKLHGRKRSFWQRVE